MLPKSSKQFLKPTAEELGHEIQVINDVTGFFYTEVRKALTEMRGPIVHVPNLGSFKAKPGELPKLKVKYEKHLTVLQPETFNQMATKKDVENRLERVNNLINLMKSEKERRAEFNKLKNKTK